ncbi:MAG: fumarylacetoacetate hydrolase family protein [Peptococcaceae bacterium]|nr:fumarylacetoacetate hydrolase family protein [Peptococcaceae bacterium]
MLKMGRFDLGGEIFYGLVDGSRVSRVEDPFRSPVPSGRTYGLEELKVLAPCEPGKAVCVGLNYRDHALELGLEPPEEPVIFLKPASALAGPGDFIEYPDMSRRVDYEAELAIVIGARCKNVPAGDAPEYILGYTCANDVTARDLQAKDGQWTRSKSFDTFLPLGPYIITGINPDRLDISLYLNGEIRQKSNTSNLIFKTGELVSFISRVMTLEPGDVILTGTPAGVGPMQKGDRVEVVVESVGTLANTVR